jgi:hypothetical protein
MIARNLAAPKASLEELRHDEIVTEFHRSERRARSSGEASGVASAASTAGHAYYEGTRRKTIIGREVARDVDGEGGHSRGGRVSAVRVWDGDGKWIS